MCTYNKRMCLRVKNGFSGETLVLLLFLFLLDFYFNLFFKLYHIQSISYEANFSLVIHTDDFYYGIVSAVFNSLHAFH